MCYKLLGVFCLFLSSAVHAADKAEYEKFFAEFQRLGTEFNVSLSQLYTDDAIVKGMRRKPDGTAETMTINGARWKSILQAVMERAKQVGDLSEYTDVDIQVKTNRARITATRYSTLNCFTDRGFYIVVKPVADKTLKIVEQFTETAPKSFCDGNPAAIPDLPGFLESTVQMINEQLPAAIDEETQLVRTSSEGSRLIYHYVLLNHTSETLSEEEANARLESLVVNQSCGSPNLRPILDQDGAITYIYTGSDAKQIIKYDIDISACSE